MMKQYKKFLLAAAAILAVAVIWFPRYGFAQRGDLETITYENGANRGIEAYRLDGGGAIALGTGITPSTTLQGYPGFKIPFVNGGAPTVAGQVITAVSTATVGGTGMVSALLATTTVMGIVDGVYATGAVGLMTVDGYALALTTGAVHQGDILVTTATAVGYLGATAAPTSGTDVGVAMGQGTATGGTVLIRLN